METVGGLPEIVVQLAVSSGESWGLLGPERDAGPA